MGGSMVNIISLYSDNLSSKLEVNVKVIKFVLLRSF